MKRKRTASCLGNRIGLPAKRTDLTGTELEKRFLVFPETGEIFYKRFSIKRGDYLVPATEISGGGSSGGGGYVRVHLGPFLIRGHHLVWVWCTGKWPTTEIDHKNGERADNRFENLRAATTSQNRTNKRRQSNNRSGFKWVSKQGDTWRADMGYRDAAGVKQRIRIWNYPTAEAAYQAIVAKAKELHGEFFNPG